MRINALDHVNIIVPDLEAAVRFYTSLLSLVRRDAPPPLQPREAAWMCDGEGRPIIHLNSLDCARVYDRNLTPAPTGALHHIALNCTGYDEMIERVKNHGLDYGTNQQDSIGLRQIFFFDPHHVLLELNFLNG